MIDLARALARDPQLLLLDEITAALPSDLAERVFAVMRERRERGRSVLFITHRLDEVIATCDRATVLRDGRAVGTLVPAGGRARRRSSSYMLGEDARARARRPRDEPRAWRRRPVPRASGEPRSRCATSSSATTRSGVSFELRAGRDPRRRRARGPGPGRAVRLRSPAQRTPSGGEIARRGQRRSSARTPYDAIRAGVVLVPGRPRARPAAAAADPREHRAPLYNRVRRWGPITPRRRAPPRARTRSSGCRSTRARSARRAGCPAATSRS